MPHPRLLALGLTLGLSLPSCVVVDARPATPQRPTFSSNTNTTAVGTFETEIGIDDDFKSDRSDSDRTGTLVVKYGARETTELFVAGVPYVETQTPTGRATGHGETRLGVRERFWENEEGDLSFAVQAEVEFPTGSTTDGISNGEEDFYASAILSGTNPDWGWTLFLQHGRIDPVGSDRTGQDALAFAVDLPLDDQFTGFLEVAALRTRALSSYPRFVTGGVAWAQDPALVWDLSLVRRLNDDGPGTRVQLGATVNWGRLFGRDERTGGAN